MDRVTKSLMYDFRNQFDIPENLKDEKLFEYFSCYTILANILDNSFLNVGDVIESSNNNDRYKVAVVNGGGGDLGIDSLAIIIEGEIIYSIEELEEIFNDRKVDDVQVIFIQSKTSSKFEGNDIRNFGDGIYDFVSGTNNSANSDTSYKIDQFNFIIDNIEKVSRLRAKAYFVTTGIWMDDKNINSKIEKVKKLIESAQLFDTFDFYPIDASTLKRYYRSIGSQIEKKFQFSEKIALPDINGVIEAYIGYVNVNDYLNILLDDEGELRKSLFYDNVRDYQGKNEVNSKIELTLQSDNSERMLLLNNGITVIAEHLQVRGKEVIISNYQIVNGYQTSYTIFENRAQLKEKDINVPIKLINTNDDELVNEIIIANNSQTAVKEEELISLTKFQKELEMYYESLDDDDHKLFYERRSKQFANDKKISKTRIVTISDQLKSFSAMYLDDAHMASRYYGRLRNKNTKVVFVEHKYPDIMFYTSSYALYLIEYRVRNGLIDRKYRKFKYFLLMMIRIYISKTEKLVKKKKAQESMCMEILEVIKDRAKFDSLLKTLLEVIDKTVEDIESKEITKTSQLTTDLKEKLKLELKK